jgi:hypothetical protein
MSKAVKRMTDEEMLRIMDQACQEYEGHCSVLESALGALVLGREIGWQALRLMHSGRTYRRYEGILGVRFRDVLEERTKQSDRMMGIRMADKLGKFWQVVTAGQVPARRAGIAKGT